MLLPPQHYSCHIQKNVLLLFSAGKIKEFNTSQQEMVGNCLPKKELIQTWLTIF